MTDLNVFGNTLTLKNINITNYQSIITEINKSDAARQGIHWVIRDITNEPSLFTGKTLAIDYPIPNARPTVADSRIDVYCANCAPPLLKIEYKSGPGSITSSKIKDQFIERDLFNASNLNEIQWRMDQTGFTKEQLAIWMKQNRGSIENLGIAKIKGYFPNDQLFTESNFVDRFISKFDNDALFTSIFK